MKKMFKKKKIDFVFSGVVGLGSRGLPFQKSSMNNYLPLLYIKIHSCILYILRLNVFMIVAKN